TISRTLACSVTPASSGLSGSWKRTAGPSADSSAKGREGNFVCPPSSAGVSTSTDDSPFQGAPAGATTPPSGEAANTPPPGAARRARGRRSPGAPPPPPPQPWGGGGAGGANSQTGARHRPTTASQWPRPGRPGSGT